MDPRQTPNAPFATHFVPSQEAVEGGYDTESPERSFRWRCHCHALAAILAWCRQHNATLTLFDLGYPHAFSAKIEKWATEHDASYSPAGKLILEQARQGEAVYLVDDGHWTPQGCRAIARELAGHHHE